MEKLVETFHSQKYVHFLRRHSNTGYAPLCMYQEYWADRRGRYRRGKERQGEDPTASNNDSRGCEGEKARAVAFADSVFENGNLTPYSTIHMQ